MTDWGVSVTTDPDPLSPGAGGTFHFKVRNLSATAKQLSTLVGLTRRPRGQADAEACYLLAGPGQDADGPEGPDGVGIEVTSANKDDIDCRADTGGQLGRQDTVDYLISSRSPLPAGGEVTFTVSGARIDSADGDGGAAEVLVRHDGETGEVRRLAVPRGGSVPSGPLQDPPGWETGETGAAAALLTFSLTGQGNLPVNVGTVATLEFTVANHGASTVNCDRIALTVSLGEGESALCAQKGDLPTDDKLLLPKGWKRDTTTGGETYAFRTKATRVPIPPVTKPGAHTLRFTLPDVKIGRTSGQAVLQVTETTSTDQQPADQQRSGTAALVKHPARFWFDYLAPAVPEVASGQSTKLLWAAENVDRYVLSSDDTGVGTPAKGDQEISTGKLTKACGYTLEAFADATLSHRHQAIVEVASPSVTLHDVTVLESLSVPNAGYQSAAKNPSYRTNDQKDQPLVLAEAEKQGARWALIAVTGADGLTEGKAPPALDVVVTPSGGGAEKKDELLLNGENSPVGVLVPADATLSVQPAESWHKWSGSTLNADLQVVLSTPQILPATS